MVTMFLSSTFATLPAPTETTCSIWLTNIWTPISNVPTSLPTKPRLKSTLKSSVFGDNAYFYDAAEGLLTATILLVAEFCEPQKSICEREAPAAKRKLYVLGGRCREYPTWKRIQQKEKG